jgi:hypothetical protein
MKAMIAMIPAVVMALSGCKEENDQAGDWAAGSPPVLPQNDPEPSLELYQAGDAYLSVWRESVMMSQLFTDRDFRNRADKAEQSQWKELSDVSRGKPGGKEMLDALRAHKVTVAKLALAVARAAGEAGRVNGNEAKAKCSREQERHLKELAKNTREIMGWED